MSRHCDPPKTASGRELYQYRPPLVQLGKVEYESDSSDTSSRSRSTTAASIVESLRYPTPLDPLNTYVRPFAETFIMREPTYTAQLYARLPASHNAATYNPKLDRAIGTFEEMSHRLIGSHELALGWLDNEKRRLSRQVIAIPKGQRAFEKRKSFIERMEKGDKPKKFNADGEGSDEEEEDDELNERDDLPSDEESDSDGNVEAAARAIGQTLIESADNPLSVPSAAPQPVTDPKAVHGPLRKHLHKALESIKEGARQALEFANKSSPHALPKDHLIRDFETEDGSIRLKPHQKDGVGRILHAEKSGKGWILGDDPGLGKTYQVVGVTKEDLNTTTKKGTTLGIVPLGLMPYWEGECRRARLKVHRYHGAAARVDGTKHLLKYDVVLTTYETLVHQWSPYDDAREDWPAARCGEREKEVKAPKKRRQARTDGSPKFVKKPLVTKRVKAPLYEIEWRRVFVEEAHRIKKAETKASRAVVDLKAERRGCVTGTPLQNDYTDFYAIARFLRLRPWDDWNLFQQCFIKKADKDAVNSSAAAVLDRDMRVALACLRNSVTIRRVKGQIFDGKAITGVAKPEKQAVPVELGPQYQSLQNERKDMWDAEYRIYLRQNAKSKNGSGFPSRPDIFVDLLYGQLEAIHHSLPTAGYGDLGKGDAEGPERCDIAFPRPDGNSKRIHLPDRAELMERFENASKEDQMKSSKTCRDEYVRRVTEECSEGSELIDTACNLVEEITSDEQRRASSITDPVQRKKEAAYGKTLFFSPFLAALDCAGVSLTRRGLKFYELNGHCTAKEREETLRRFEEKDATGSPKDFEDPNTSPDTTRILLASTRVAAEGFNLVHACHVVMLAPTWNPYVEFQALARAHRIGQPRIVTVYNIYTQNSMHERVRMVQNLKLRKVTGVMDDAEIRKAAPEVLKWTLTTFKSSIQKKAEKALAELSAGLEDEESEHGDDERVEEAPIKLEDNGDNGYPGQSRANAAGTPSRATSNCNQS